MRIIFLIIFLAAIAGIIWPPMDNNGQIIIEWLGFHVEISVILLVLLLLSFFVIAFYLIYFLIFLKNIPNSLKKYYQKKQNHQDLMLLLQGFEFLYCEDLEAAEKIAKKLKANKDHYQLQQLKPIVSSFIAQYSELQYLADHKSEELAENAYHDLLNFKETKFIGLKGLVLLRMRQKIYHDAMIYAEKAYAINSKSSWLLRALVEINNALGNYGKAEEMIKKLLKYNFINNNEADNLLIANYVAHANYYITHQQEEGAIEFLEKALKIDPGYDKAVYTLARIFSQKDRKKAAQKIIEKAWKKSPSLSLTKFILSLYKDYPVNKKAALLKDLIDLMPEA